MGSLMRSEEMTKCVVYFETDVSYACTAALGELGIVQFLDMNKNMLVHNRKYTNEVRRCEEMDRQLRYFKKQIEEEKVEMDQDFVNLEAPPVSKMTEMESGFENMEKRLLEVNENRTVLINKKLRLVEFQQVLQNLNLVFAENLPERNNQPEQQDIGKLGFTAGVVPLEKLVSLERLLWFACRGNALVKNVDIPEPLEDPVTRVTTNKTVVFIFYQGEQLKGKVTKILEGFHANIYPCPENSQESREKCETIGIEIADLETIINETNSYRIRQLKEIAKRLPEWDVQVKKMKAIFHTLNMFSVDITHKYLVGECWCPVVDMEVVKKCFAEITGRGGDSMAMLNIIESGNEVPPTYNKTNKFTKVFQSIVDSYGVATYQEVNPAPFLIITFPFLFSLMFGDAGHGVLVFLIGLWMVVKEGDFINKKSDNEIWKIFFGGRYIILLMGAFSIYSGLIYNDVFAKPINIFGSAWSANPLAYNHMLLKNNREMILSPGTSFINGHNTTDYRGYPFAFGMDPVWLISKNKITWLNSFKMKVSIIFGVFQMFFGVTLGFFNHKHFRDPLSVFCEFLPQFLFLMAMFGYLVVLIFYKWIYFNASRAACAPSLLINLINTFLYSYTDAECSPTNFYTNQKEFQTFLLLLVVVCIPWLLLIKPLILRHKNKKQQLLKGNTANHGNNSVVIEMTNQGFQPDTDDIANNNQPKIVAEKQAGHGQGHSEEFSFGDVFIHQCIHTIEYCLGCISHTASYLRLWALSLAHAELSEVLWTMVLKIAFTMEAGTGSVTVGCLVIFFLWAAWAVLTVAILLLMEGLSAFLHTLRLHWVEFQSKFYKGDGIKFTPFCFKKILKHSDD